jgi:hypothetical protein
VAFDGCESSSLHCIWEKDNVFKLVPDGQICIRPTITLSRFHLLIVIVKLKLTIFLIVIKALQETA